MGEPALDGIVSASLSDVGRVRQANEDCVGEFRHASAARLFILAEGRGGHRGGATASRTVVETIGEEFERQPTATAESLAEAVRTANRRVHQIALEDPQLRGMGTTVVCLLITAPGVGWVAHVGDSRAYRLRDRSLEGLTEDHSVVAAMVRQGLISEQEALTHPRRNEILRSVGVESEVEVEIQSIEIHSGDRFLLCSDGLTGLVSDTQIAVLLENDDPECATRALIDAANERGGNDNITAQIATIPEDASPTSADAMTSAGFGDIGISRWALVAAALVVGLVLWWWLG